jgi:hypothetical protein
MRKSPFCIHLNRTLSKPWYSPKPCSHHLSVSGHVRSVTLKKRHQTPCRMRVVVCTRFSYVLSSCPSLLLVLQRLTVDATVLSLLDELVSDTSCPRRRRPIAGVGRHSLLYCRHEASDRQLQLSLQIASKCRSVDGSFQRRSSEPSSPTSYRCRKVALKPLSSRCYHSSSPYAHRQSSSACLGRYPRPSPRRDRPDYSLLRRSCASCALQKLRDCLWSAQQDCAFPTSCCACDRRRRFACSACSDGSVVLLDHL